MEKESFLHTRSPLFAVLVSALLAAALLPSCTKPAETSYGSLTINLASPARNLSPSPAVSLDVASYDLSGTGPSEQSFQKQGVTGAESSCTIDDLLAGDWTVTATGRNAEGTAIVEATGKATVQPAKVASLALDCLPLVGDGSFGLELSWTAGLLSSPKVSATLSPVKGGDPIVWYPVVTGSAVSATKSVGNGYYTLSLILSDGSTGGVDNQVWAKVESVLILTGKTTTGSWNLETADLAHGGITINLGSAPPQPLLEVAISGVPALLAQGEAATATALASPSSPQTVFTWYLNGVQKAVGASYALPTDLAARSYNLDVVASSSTRSGSAGMHFVVHATDMALLTGTIAGLGANGGRVTETSEGSYHLVSGPGAADQDHNELVATPGGSPRLGGKAFLGLTDAHMKPLADPAVFRISFTRSFAETTTFQYFNLIVDGPGVVNDRGGQGVLVAITPPQDTKGSIVLDPSTTSLATNPLIDGFYGGTIAGFNVDATGKELAKAAWPKAFRLSDLFGKGLHLVNAVTKDEGTPQTKRLAGALIIVGDSTKSATSNHTVDLSELSWRFQ
jgi:hypothetical protein